MTREEFMNKLQLCYFGEKKAFNEIVKYFDTLQKTRQNSEKNAENLQRELDIKNEELGWLDAKN